jgi:glycerol-3-phosphate O-acyltransferase
MTESASHPVIRFTDLKVIPGPLSELEGKRASILTRVTGDTIRDLSSKPTDFLLQEALYAERTRLKRFRPNVFTRARKKRDSRLIGRLHGGLLQHSALVDRSQLMQELVSHFAEEIGGHFDPRVYKFAVRAVPWGFSWLLNAASVQRFLPWGMSQSLASRLHIVGEVPALQKLAKKGTILMVPTHQSNIDSVLIGYVIYLMSLPPFAYGAGLNLFSNPALSFFMSNLGAYTVDRQKTSTIYKSVLKNYSTRILREGIHSIFFPGGGRARSGAVESKLKLGLLGTGLDAQLQNLREGKPNPNVYVVPMVMSYHFVLEASSLIEDYLAEAGKHRFIIDDDESWQAIKVLNFFWKLFSSQSGITARIGRPMDIFGNFVDEEGRSIGPNGTTIDPVKWLTSKGELRPDAARDREYTQELGRVLVTRFHRENTVLTSHLVAFSLFEALRKQYPDMDLYRFMRLSLAQRSMPYDDFLRAADAMHAKVRAAAGRGEFYLSPELDTQDTGKWVDDGIRNLGLLHEASVVRARDGAIWTEDMTLLYYYRNRLAGYGLSALADCKKEAPGQYDRKGFLA